MHVPSSVQVPHFTTGFAVSITHIHINTYHRSSSCAGYLSMIQTNYTDQNMYVVTRFQETSDIQNVIRLTGYIQTPDSVSNFNLEMSPMHTCKGLPRVSTYVDTPSRQLSVNCNLSVATCLVSSFIHFITDRTLCLLVLPLGYFVTGRNGSLIPGSN